MGFVGLGLVLLGLVLLWVWDRRSKRRGHTLRRPDEIWRAEQDIHRNVRAADSILGNPVDKDWDKPDDRRPR
jgi:hypothetical protein